jgi:hypothetical protein
MAVFAFGEEFAGSEAVSEWRSGLYLGAGRGAPRRFMAPCLGRHRARKHPQSIPEILPKSEGEEDGRK